MSAIEPIRSHSTYHNFLEEYRSPCRECCKSSPCQTRPRANAEWASKMNMDLQISRLLSTFVEKLSHRRTARLDPLSRVRPGDLPNTKIDEFFLALIIDAVGWVQSVDVGTSRTPVLKPKPAATHVVLDVNDSKIPK